MRLFSANSAGGSSDEPPIWRAAGNDSGGQHTGKRDTTAASKGRSMTDKTGSRRNEADAREAEANARRVLLREQNIAAGERIERAQIAAGYDIGREVASIIGVDEDTFSNWVNGRNYPKPHDLRQLCELFDVDADYILFGMEKGLSLDRIGKLRRVPEEALRRSKRSGRNV